MKTAIVVGAAAVGLYAFWKWYQQPTPASDTLAGTDMTSGGQSNTVYGPSGWSPGTVTTPPAPSSHGWFQHAVPDPITAPTPSNFFNLRNKAFAAISRPTPPAPAPTWGFSNPLRLGVIGTSPSSPIT